MLLVAAPGNPLNPLNKTEFCWLDSYGRGVGTIPSSCSSGTNTSGICYQPCASGAKNVAGVCWDACRTGYKDTGTGCQLNESASYVPGKSCSKKDDLGTCWAWKTDSCRDGYKNTAGVCWNEATTYYVKGSSPQKTALPSCGRDKQKDVGLCYDACRSGTKGAGPVCWGACSGARPVACGAGCAKDKASCDRVLAAQVSNTLMSAVNIGLMVVTVGAATPAAEAEAQAKTEAQVEKSIADWIKYQATAQYQMMERAYAGTASADDLARLGWQGWQAGKVVINQSEKAYFGKMDQMSSAGLSMDRKIALYAEMYGLAAAALLDPTGLVSAGASFLYGQCSKVGTYP